MIAANLRQHGEAVCDGLAGPPADRLREAVATYKPADAELAIALVTYVDGRTLAMVVAQLAPTPRSAAENAITWHLIHVLDKLERGMQ